MLEQKTRRTWTRMKPVWGAITLCGLSRWTRTSKAEELQECDTWFLSPRNHSMPRVFLPVSSSWMYCC
jgi:hypothetical protein